MELNLTTAGARYYERVQFWAREMALILQRHTYDRQQHLLHHLATLPLPLGLAEIARTWDAPEPGTPAQRYDVTQKSLRILREARLIRRENVGLHAVYALTDLGRGVLESLGTPQTPRAQPHYPWVQQYEKTLLRALATQEQPLDIQTLGSLLPGVACLTPATRRAYCSELLLHLVAEALVHRTRTGQRYVYALTEKGRQHLRRLDAPC